MSLTCPRCNRVVDPGGPPPAACPACGQRFPLPGTVAVEPGPPATVAEAPPDGGPGKPPAEVGGYRLVRLLGAGGMGKVYEAEEVASGRRVALKLLAPDVATSPVAVERFRREGRLASAIAHPRCVFVLAADEDAGRPYIAMELMPGDTLESLVERDGPLPPREAVACILDVIDGLREAHRLGVVHRDVKPSNCFLGPDGRVKIGDFGLAKSLGRGTRLTGTGTFLGTVLYCSPEQVRGDAVNAQSDVYSVAATLYYLLTGKAPFEGGDAAATLARIVADPAPSPRALRPAVPAALDRVVRRGLERDRERRWVSLDELRAALLPFARGRLAVGVVGLRIAADLLDWLITFPLGLLQVGLISLLGPNPDPYLWRLAVLGGLLPGFLYFAVPEGVWGCTLGKRWLRLRVGTLTGTAPPGLGRALWRTGVWYALLAPPLVLPGLVVGPGGFTDPWLAVLVLGLELTGYVVGLTAMASTMRFRNGYRCLHDILSGTRVVLLPEPERRLALPAYDLGQLASPAPALPPRLGSYHVRGDLGGVGAERLLLGEDGGLGRRVLLWVRPSGAAPFPAARRDVGRPARPRWLAAGHEHDLHWDAFLAPEGCPLAEVVARRGRLPWAEFRPVLGQLVNELAAASADGTLPQTLTVGQVWLGPGGQLVLLDLPPGGAADKPAEVLPPPFRAQALLRQVVVLALEGRPRAPAAPPEPVKAPLPGSAVRLVDRLSGGPTGEDSLARARADLAATRNRPAEVSRTRRAAHLAIQAAFLALGLGVMTVSGCMSAFMPSSFLLAEQRRAMGVSLDLERGGYRDFVTTLLNPAPSARLAALVQLDADLRLGGRLRQRRREIDRAYAQRLEAMSPPSARI